MPARVLNLHDEPLGDGVLCDRTTDWGNPFKVGRDGSRSRVLIKHGLWLLKQRHLIARLPELKGHNLGCWCKPLPCHCDLLLRLANPETKLLFKR